MRYILNPILRTIQAIFIYSFIYLYIPIFRLFGFLSVLIYYLDINKAKEFLKSFYIIEEPNNVFYIKSLFHYTPYGKTYFYKNIFHFILKKKTYYDLIIFLNNDSTYLKDTYIHPDVVNKYNFGEYKLINRNDNYKIQQNEN